LFSSLYTIFLEKLFLVIILSYSLDVKPQSFIISTQEL